MASEVRFLLEAPKIIAVMKITKADKELAGRFPKSNPNARFNTPGWFGKTMADARISPDQLTRLLKLNLIKVAPHGVNGTEGLNVNTPGTGWKREVEGFVSL